MTPVDIARLRAALAWGGRNERVLVVAALLPLLGLWAALYLPLLPNEQGNVPADYALWLSDLLAGYYWYLTNGLRALPWFSPSQCGGVAFFADPQVPYLSLPQALTLLVSPMTAVRTTILAAAGAGFLGTYALARLPFRASAPAALLAAVVFLYNAFFAVRMLIGHLPYYPFMLLPALLLTALPWPGRPAGGAAEEALRVGGGALLVATMIQAGMAQLAVPAVVGAAMVLLLAGLAVGWSWRALARAVAAGLLGAALSAGKLAAAFALLAQFPRDRYPLPGLDGLANILWLPLQMLFLGPPDAPRQVMFYDPFATIRQAMIEQHEFVYGVTPVPAVLVLAAVAVWLLRRRGTALRGRVPCIVALAVLALLPVAANAYAPGWNALLKSLPLLRESSNLLRWFAADILPLTLAAALALDRLAGRHGLRLAAPLAVVAILVVLGWTMRTDLSPYEEQGYGPTAFPIAPIEDGWAAVHAGAPVPPVTGLGAETEHAGAAGFTAGLSQLSCYWPLFGYWREDFAGGTLHPGEALQAAGGRLNLRNPVCDLFPAENMCRPGAQFGAEDSPAAQAFLSYRPLPFRAPWWAEAAAWLGIGTALLLALVLPVCGWLRWRASGDGLRCSAAWRRRSASGRPVEEK